MDLIFKPYAVYAAIFKGRATRTQYWTFQASYFSIYIVAISILAITGGLSAQAGAGAFNATSIIGFVLYIVIILFASTMFVPSLSLAGKRLHDTQRSAWWLALGFLPFIGWIVLIVFLLLPGTPGGNLFGADPRAGNGEDPGDIDSTFG
jgi:uncharacterized membrane protein YhaH (DUF805 family)